MSGMQRCTEKTCTFWLITSAVVSMVSSLLEGAESCQGGEVPPPPGGEVPRNVRDAMAQKNKVDLFGPFFPRFFWEGWFWIWRDVPGVIASHSFFLDSEFNYITRNLASHLFWCGWNLRRLWNTHIFALVGNAAFRRIDLIGKDPSKTHPDETRTHPFLQAVMFFCFLQWIKNSWWFRNPASPGMYTNTLEKHGDIHHINWWSPDFFHQLDGWAVQADEMAELRRRIVWASKGCWPSKWPTLNIETLV